MDIVHDRDKRAEESTRIQGVACHQLPLIDTLKYPNDNFHGKKICGTYSNKHEFF